MSDSRFLDALRETWYAVNQDVIDGLTLDSSFSETDGETFNV